MSTPETKSETQTENPRELHDVIVVMEGVAQGHEFIVDETFCKKLVQLGNEAGSVKVRINHPGKRGDVLSIVGEISNFYLSKCVDKENVEQTCVKAKTITIYDLPDNHGEKIIALAKQAGKFFGMSIDALVKLSKKTIGGIKVAVLEQLNSVDFVDTPAATPSLFAADLGSGHIQLSSRQAQVINQETSETLEKVVLQNNSEEDTITENLPMAKNKSLEEAKPEAKVDEKDIHQVLEEMSKRLEAMEEFHKAVKAKWEAEESEEAKKEEKKEEVKPEVKPEVKAEEKEEEDEDQKLEAKMEAIATKKFTALLAKTGAKVSPEDVKPLVEAEVVSAPKFDQAALEAIASAKAAGFELTPVELEAYAKNLETAKKFAM